MRIHFVDTRHPARVAKTLKRAASGLVSPPLPLSKCQETVADMFGYADWHELQRSCSASPPSPWDADVDEVTASARRSQYVEALVRAGLTAKEASALIAEIRPTSRLVDVQPGTLDALIRSGAAAALFAEPLDVFRTISATSEFLAFKKALHSAISEDRFWYQRAAEKVFEEPPAEFVRFMRFIHRDGDHEAWSASVFLVICWCRLKDVATSDDFTPLAAAEADGFRKVIGKIVETSMAIEIGRAQMGLPSVLSEAAITSGRLGVQGSSIREPGEMAGLFREWGSRPPFTFASCRDLEWDDLDVQEDWIFDLDGLELSVRLVVSPDDSELSAAFRELRPRMSADDFRGMLVMLADRSVEDVPVASDEYVRQDTLIVRARSGRGSRWAPVAVVAFTWIAKTDDYWMSVGVDFYAHFPQPILSDQQVHKVVACALEEQVMFTLQNDWARIGRPGQKVDMWLHGFEQEPIFDFILQDACMSAIAKDMEEDREGSRLKVMLRRGTHLEPLQPASAVPLVMDAASFPGGEDFLDCVEQLRSICLNGFVVRPKGKGFAVTTCDGPSSIRSEVLDPEEFDEIVHRMTTADVPAVLKRIAESDGIMEKMLVVCLSDIPPVALRIADWKSECWTFVPDVYFLLHSPPSDDAWETMRRTFWSKFGVPSRPAVPKPDSHPRPLPEGRP